MNQEVIPKLIAVQERLAGDPEYLALLKEYHLLDRRMLQLFESLPEEETGLIMDYLGLIGEMHRKMLFTACI